MEALPTYMMAAPPRAIMRNQSTNSGVMRPSLPERLVEGGARMMRFLKSMPLILMGEKTCEYLEPTEMISFRDRDFMVFCLFYHLAAEHTILFSFSRPRLDCAPPEWYLITARVREYFYCEASP